MAVLTAEQHDLLERVQARLIPAEGERPSAAESGCPAAVDGYLALRPELRRPVLGALQAIAAAAGAEGFAALDESAQYESLRLVEGTHPNEFAELVRETYNAYYSNPAVLERLGAPGPPQPHGYATPPPLDPDRLEAVRRRGRLWKSG